MVNEPVSAVSANACASCGRDAEHDFADMWLCTDCYYTAGSTCAGVRVARAVPAPAGEKASSSDAVC